jgi:hypothetical protein
MTSEAWHRRHAIQIAAALPETTEDALIVLQLAKELVEQFLADHPRDRDRGTVVSLSSSMSGLSR